MTKATYDTQLAPAILIGVQTQGLSQDQCDEHLDELGRLADTAGFRAVHTWRIKLREVHPGNYLQKGKLDELKALVAALDNPCVIFDDELSPTQFRNLEKALETTLLDRTGLILQIFSETARSGQAKAQVELARLEYELPRLRRMWTHLTRERGGIGLKGAGEQELETDRRIIRNKIAHLKQSLRDVEKQSATRRKHRGQLVRAALVGYTNAGKSTLMNVLAKDKVLSANRLFSTLDTTVRRCVVNNVPLLLSDTVGFIRKLPHGLVESFKSTLAEVREADLLLHVVDASNHQYMDQLRVVENTLSQLGVAEKPTLLVFNKIDCLAPDDLADLEQTWVFARQYPCAFISAGQRLGIDQLRVRMAGLAADLYRSKFPGLDFYNFNHNWDEGLADTGEA